MEGFILHILDINTEVKRMEGFILHILDINTEVKRMEGFILLILDINTEVKRFSPLKKFLKTRPRKVHFINICIEKKWKVLRTYVQIQLSFCLEKCSPSFLSPFLCMYPRASVQSENEKKLYRKAS
jgi:hypothetical protein